MNTTNEKTNQATSNVAEVASQHMDQLAHSCSSSSSRRYSEMETAPKFASAKGSSQDKRLATNLFDMLGAGLRLKKAPSKACDQCNRKKPPAAMASDDNNNCLPATTTTATAVSRNTNADMIEDTSASTASTRFSRTLIEQVPNACQALYNGPVNELAQAEGEGQLIWNNGDRYIGPFFNGKQHGQGALYFGNGAEYSGNWECGFMHGPGTHKLNNGDVFTGNFINGQREGQGTMTFATGDSYVGEWQNGLMHGLGRYYYTNGQRFEGNFQYGKRQGQGKHQFPDGSVLVHRYVQNDRVGEGVLWSNDRQRVWRMVGTTRKGRINMQQANLIMLRCEEEY